jgi:hypothetical protein
MRLSLLVVTCAIVSSGCEASTFPELPNDTEMSTAFPELSRPGDVYMEVEPIYSEFDHGATLVSRYVLYNDGTFGLQMVSSRAGVFEYSRRYGDLGIDDCIRLRCREQRRPLGGARDAGGRGPRSGG